MPNNFDLEVEKFVKDIHGFIKSKENHDINGPDMGLLQGFLEESLTYIGTFIDWKREHRRWNNCTPRKKART